MADVTYGQLDKVLRSLGFSCRSTTLRSKALVYELPHTDAMLILPDAPADNPVLPHHLAAVRGTLKAYGIADPFDSAAEPQKAS
jgi:hypothetical protein